jgi:hypothetical protein
LARIVELSPHRKEVLVEREVEEARSGIKELWGILK